MKVTVCFSEVKVVVPCGQGDMLVKELVDMAVMRYQKSTLQLRTPDKSTSSSQSNELHPDGEKAHSAAMQQQPTYEERSCEVDSLTLARDGGILDWDDRVGDVLDDRELLIAHYHVIPVRIDSNPPEPLNPSSRCNGGEDYSDDTKQSETLDGLQSETDYMPVCSRELRKQSPPPPPPTQASKVPVDSKRRSTDKASASPSPNSIQKFAKAAAPPPPERHKSSTAALSDIEKLTGNSIPEHSGGSTRQSIDYNSISCPIPRQYDQAHQMGGSCIHRPTETADSRFDGTGRHLSNPKSSHPQGLADWDRIIDALSTGDDVRLGTYSDMIYPQTLPWSKTSNATTCGTSSSGADALNRIKPSNSLPKLTCSYPNPTTNSGQMYTHIDHNTSSNQPPSDSRHAYSIARPNRKYKTRRMPRAPPPPPPVSSAQQLHSTSSITPPPQSTSSSNKSSSTDSLIDQSTIRRVHHVNNRGQYCGISKTSSQDEVAGHLEPSNLLAYPMCPLHHHHHHQTSMVILRKKSPPPPPPPSILNHWHSQIDQIPGYNPQELADAERDYHQQQQLQCSRLANSISNDRPDRNLSMDEERMFSLKPNPPKRSPFTALTKLSFLTPSGYEVDESEHGRSSTGEGGGNHRGRGEYHETDFPEGDSEDDQERGNYSTERQSSDADDVHSAGRSLSSSDIPLEVCRTTAEDELLHMTELLSKRRESEARRHLMMAELEGDIERDHRLQAAATAMALVAVSNLSPSHKARLEQIRANNLCLANSKCNRAAFNPHDHSAPSCRGINFQRQDAMDEDISISLTKSSAGLGFSLTTRAIEINRSGIATQQGKIPASNVCVKSILHGGAAIRNGQLRVGDRLLKVDDLDVTRKSQSQIVSILRTKPVGSTVNLLVRRKIIQTNKMGIPNDPSDDCSMCAAEIHRGRAVAAASTSICPSGCLYGLNRTEKRSGIHLMSPPPSPMFYHTTGRGPFATASPSPLMFDALRSKNSGSVTLMDRHTGRCASPPSTPGVPLWSDAITNVAPPIDYPSFIDVIFLRLDISLSLTTVPEPEPDQTNRMSLQTLPNTGVPTVRHMRLGISVREANSSRASKIADRTGTVVDLNTINLLPFGKAEEFWSGADSIYGGVLIKGVIEGGAAHKDGRLRVGDELLEVNEVSLVNVVNPLPLLRSVLRRLTNEDDGNRKKSDSLVDQSEKLPFVSLLVVRQMRHRRSASGHTLASNSEFWTEGSSTSTVMTNQTCVTTIPIVSSAQLLDHMLPSKHPSSHRSMQISADVHVPDPPTNVDLANRPS